MGLGLGSNTTNSARPCNTPPPQCETLVQQRWSSALIGPAHIRQPRITVRVSATLACRSTMSHADRSFEGGLQNHGSADNLSYDDIMAFAARPPSSGVQSGLAVPRRRGRPRKVARDRSAAIAGKRKAHPPKAARKEPSCFGCQTPKTEMAGYVGQLEVADCTCSVLWCFDCTLQSTLVAQIKGEIVQCPTCRRVARALSRVERGGRVAERCELPLKDLKVHVLKYADTPWVGARP